MAWSFTIGRGTDVQAAAVRALAPHVVGLDVDLLCAEASAASRAS